MQAIFWTVFVLAVVSLSKANRNITATASNDEGLISSMNKNEPNKAACFPVCFPQMGKRDDLSRAKPKELMQDERPARAIDKLHAKFGRWLEDRFFPSWRSLRLSAGKRQQRLRTQRAWKRTVTNDSQNKIKRVNSSERISRDRYQLSRANLI